MHKTKAQKDLISLIRSYRCMRERHLQTAAQILLGKNEDYVKTTLKELEASGQIERNGEIITPKGGEHCSDRIDAFDILLQFDNGKIQQIDVGKDPFLLTFYREKNCQLTRYDIIRISNRGEDYSGILTKLNPKYRVVIFLLDTLMQADNIKTSCSHCFAMRNKEAITLFK